jgi:hypothetical protein
MGGINLDPLLRTGLDPSAEGAAAWKHERMGADAINHGELEFSIKRSRRCRLPHLIMYALDGWRKH